MVRWYPGGWRYIYRASYGAKKFVVWLPIWTAKGFHRKLLWQQTTVHQNWRELQITFSVAHCGESRFSQEKCRFLRFVSCSLWISISLYSVFSHATSYKASQKMHIHTGYIWQAFLRSSYLGSEIFCMIQYPMARIALVSLFSIVHFYRIGGLIGCQYIHTGWILNATSVNKLDTERKKWKNMQNTHLFSSMSNSWFLLLGQMYVHNCYIWSLSLHSVFSYAMHQCACMGQQIFTLVAFVWLLSTVCNHMTLNNICSREGIITLVAFVRFDWTMFFLKNIFTVVVRFFIYICFLAPQFTWLKNYFFK